MTTLELAQKLDKCLAAQVRLQKERDSLLEQVQIAANIYALQARRDCAEPDMLKGWRDLEEKARAAIARAEEGQ